MHTVELPSGKQVEFTLPILNGKAALEDLDNEGYTREELIVATSITSINGVAVVGSIELLMEWDSKDIQYLLEYFSVINSYAHVLLGATIQYTDPRPISVAAGPMTSLGITLTNAVRPVGTRKRAIIGDELKVHAQEQARAMMLPAWDVVA